MSGEEKPRRQRFKLPPVQGQSRIEWLADHFVQRKVVTWYDMQPHEVSMVFMPVLFGGLPGATKEQLNKIAVFAVIGESHMLDLSINGWPIFSECHIWRHSDLIRAAQLAEAMEAAMVAAKATLRGKEGAK